MTSFNPRQWLLVAYSAQGMVPEQGWLSLQPPIIRPTRPTTQHTPHPPLASALAPPLRARAPGASCCLWIALGSACDRHGATPAPGSAANASIPGVAGAAPDPAPRPFAWCPTPSRT